MASIIKPLRLLRCYGALTKSCRRMKQTTEKNLHPNILTSIYKDIPTLNCSVTDFMWQGLDEWPDKTATVCAVTGHGYTYEQIYKVSLTFAASLRSKLRLQSDDVVAVALPNIPEYPCVLLGILQAGCVASLMNPAYKTDEFQRLNEMVKAKAIVTCKHSYPNVMKALKAIKRDIPVILVEHTDLPQGAIKFAEFAEDFSIDTSCLKSVHRSSEDVAVIPFSSGTTGFPKGVVLTHGSVVALNQQISDPDIIVIKETTATYQAVIPAVLPFFHIFGFNAVMLNQLFLGCKLVTMPFFKPDMFLDTISRHRATALFIVPPMALFLGKHPMVSSKHLETVEGIICGAAPLSKEDAEAVTAKNKDLIFRQGFGMTETNGTISIGRNSNMNLPSVGFTIANTQVKISDVTTGKALGVGQEGEIWFRGPNSMREYLDNEEATKEVLTEDGWLKTGDIGKYDQEGYIYVTDRIKELIKVKGFQVAPAEIEALIRTHPKIMDCAVIAIQDPVLGEAPKAFLVPQPGQQVTENEIQEFVNTKVSDYKRLKAVQFVDSIPKSAAGKILRKDLKAKYC